MRLKPTMTSEIAAALYASKWLASLPHLSYRERERECVCVWVGKKKFWKVLTCAFCVKFGFRSISLG